MNRILLTLCTVCLCAGGLTARAAALQRADVIANPGWLLHLDCDALRPTAAGRFILSQMDQPEVKARLAALQIIVGFDLHTNVHGVTLYGDTPAPRDAVLIIYGDFDPDRLTLLAKAANQYQSSTYNGRVIHSWVNTNRQHQVADGSRVYAAIAAGKVVTGRNLDKIDQALDAIDGGASSLAASHAFPGLGLPGNGHFIEAAARKMDSTIAAPAAAIWQLSKALQLVVGETNQQFQCALTLDANDADAAGQMFSIAQGLVAVMKMQSNNRDAVQLANALDITQNGSQILGRLVLPASDVADLMQARAARMAAVRAARAQNTPPAGSGQQ